MGKWMVVLVAAGFLIPYGAVLAVTGNIHGAEYVRQQEKEAAGKYRILLDREENGGYLSLEDGRRKRNFGIKSGSGPETAGRAERNMGKNGISGKIQPSGRGSDPDQWNCDDI